MLHDIARTGLFLSDVQYLLEIIGARPKLVDAFKRISVKTAERQREGGASWLPSRRRLPAGGELAIATLPVDSFRLIEFVAKADLSVPEIRVTCSIAGRERVFFTRCREPGDANLFTD